MEHEMILEIFLIFMVIFVISSPIVFNSIFNYLDINKQVHRLNSNWTSYLDKRIKQFKITWVHSELVKDEHCGYIKILEINNQNFSHITFDSDLNYLSENSEYNKCLQNGGITEPLWDLYHLIGYKMLFISKNNNAVLEYKDGIISFENSFFSVLIKTYKNNFIYSVLSILTALVFVIYKLIVIK